VKSFTYRKKEITTRNEDRKRGKREKAESRDQSEMINAYNVCAFSTTENDCEMSGINRYKLRQHSRGHELRVELFPNFALSLSGKLNCSLTRKVFGKMSVIPRNVIRLLYKYKQYKIMDSMLERFNVLSTFSSGSNFALSILVYRLI